MSFSERHFIECHYAEIHFAQFLISDCHYCKCRGAIRKNKFDRWHKKL